MSSELLVRLKALDILVPGEVKLSHAGSSDFYIDVKKALGYPEISDLMGDELWRSMQRKPTCIAASGYGGIVLATKITDKYRTSDGQRIKLTLVRDSPKQHGLNKLIEGHVPTREDLVAIVDDVLTTGGSIRKVVEILAETHARMLGAYIVVKRGEAQMSLPAHYVFGAWELK